MKYENIMDADVMQLILQKIIIFTGESFFNLRWGSWTTQ